MIGAGGESKYKKYDHNVRENERLGMKLDYFWDDYGFSYFSVNKNRIAVEFVDSNTNVVYSFSRVK